MQNVSQPEAAAKATASQSARGPSFERSAWPAKRANGIGLVDTPNILLGAC